MLGSGYFKAISLRAKDIVRKSYFVSTVGLNEKAVREYTKHQEESDKIQLSFPYFD